MSWSGDGCTGSGIQHHLLAASFAFFAEKFNITKTSVTYMVAAEADENKAKFVVWQHKPACILLDVAQLSSNRWHNWASGGVLRSSLSVLLRGRCRCVVVFCCVFAISCIGFRNPGRPMIAKKVACAGGGFSCTALSKANNQRSNNKGCIRGGSASSGTTFEGLAAWIIKDRPSISVLENVPEIRQGYEITGIGTSDC